MSSTEEYQQKRTWPGNDSWINGQADNLTFKTAADQEHWFDNTHKPYRYMKNVQLISETDDECIIKCHDGEIKTFKKPINKYP